MSQKQILFFQQIPTPSYPLTLLKACSITMTWLWYDLLLNCLWWLVKWWPAWILLPPTLSRPGRRLLLNICHFLYRVIKKGFWINCSTSTNQAQKDRLKVFYHQPLFFFKISIRRIYLYYVAMCNLKRKIHFKSGFHWFYPISKNWLHSNFSS